MLLRLFNGNDDKDGEAHWELVPFAKSYNVSAMVTGTS